MKKLFLLSLGMLFCLNAKAGIQKLSACGIDCDSASEIERVCHGYGNVGPYGWAYVVFNKDGTKRVYWVTQKTVLNSGDHGQWYDQAVELFDEANQKYTAREYQSSRGDGGGTYQTIYKTTLYDSSGKKLFRAATGFCRGQEACPADILRASCEWSP